MHKSGITAALALLVLFGVLVFATACCCTGGLDDEELIINEPHAQPLPPVAVIAAVPSSGVEPLEVQLDASDSYDPDGTIVKYDWDFDGDGTFDLLDGGATPTHTYDPAGTYNPIVRVTDDDAMTDDATTTVEVGSLVPPVAVGEATAEGLGSTVANFDGSASFDTDGQVVQYDWDFDNDGTYDFIDGGATPTHDYAGFGTFMAILRVTDNDGLQDTTEIPVTLTDLPNVPPTAVLVPTPDSGNAPLDVTWDASGSSDPDGTIVQYDWDMDNDGTFELTDAGDSQAANYPTGGSYTVGVRVFDDDGATDQTTATVEVNNPPVADLVPTPASGNAPQAVSWDASGSTDSDGTIVQYDWDMDNDGTFEITDGGSSQPANYLTGGSYTVGVRVTDDDGATDQTTATVDINNPPIADIVPTPPSGTAPLLVDWDASGSTDSDGTIVQYDWDMDDDGIFEIIDGGPTQPANYIGGGIFPVTVRVTDDDGATDTATASVDVNEPPVADLVPTPPSGVEPLSVTWDASGSTDSDGTIVQYDWDMDNNGSYEVLDGGPSQPAVYSSFGTYTVGVRVTDDDGATDTTTASVTVLQPPTAVLLAEPPSGTEPLEVLWNAATSFDNDGTIVQYDWDMDNNGSFEILNGGSSQIVVYSNDGTYIVGVRVIDNDGLTDQTTQSVDVIAVPD